MKNEEKKKDLKFVLIFIVLFSFAFTYLFQASYAKYRKQVNASTQADIAKWVIKVNNELIANKSQLENEIIPFIDSNNYVKDGVIAPGSTGYFDLEFDTRDVDVDLTYSIDISSSDLTDYKVTHYKINQGSKREFTSNTLEGWIEKNYTGITKVRCYVAWIDTTEEAMDNASDTQYAANHNKTEIGVTITFSQRK